MYMVYWTGMEHSMKIAYSQEFESSDMVSAMKFMEELRARQRQGEHICFITMASENPNSLGLAGVADPSPDYNWKKRRP